MPSITPTVSEAVGNPAVTYVTSAGYGTISNDIQIVAIGVVKLTLPSSLHFANVLLRPSMIAGYDD